MGKTVVIGLLVIAAYTSYIQMDRWRNSETVYRSELQRDPNNLVILANLGSWLNDQNRPTEAIDPLRKATQLSPGMHISQYNLARSYMMRQGCADAEPPARKAATLRPDLADSVYLHALSLGCLGRSAEAVPVFEKAIGAGLGAALMTFAYQNLAAHSIRTLDWGRARQAITSGRQLDPAKPEWKQLEAQIPAKP